MYVNSFLEISEICEDIEQVSGLVMTTVCMDSYKFVTG
jgi:hypothetical protein